MKIALISYWNNFSLNSFGKVYFLEESYENMQKIQIWKFCERPLFYIREYAFKHTEFLQLDTM